MSFQRATNSETALTSAAKNQELCINVCNQDFVHSPYEFRFSPPVSPENSNQDISDVDTAEEYTVIAAEQHASVACMQQYHPQEFPSPQFSPYRQHLRLLSDQCDRLYDYAQLPQSHEYTDYSDYSPQYSMDANSPHVPSDILYNNGTEFEVNRNMFAPQHSPMCEMEYQRQVPLPQQRESPSAPQSESYDLSIALANMPTRILKRKRKVHRGGPSSFFLDELPQQTAASNTGSLSAIMATSAAVPKFVRSR